MGRTADLLVDQVGVIRRAVPAREPVAPRLEDGRNAAEHGRALALHAGRVAGTFRQESTVLHAEVGRRAPLGRAAIHRADAAARDQDVELVGLDAADVDDLHDHLLALDRRGTVVGARIVAAA